MTRIDLILGWSLCLTLLSVTAYGRLLHVGSGYPWTSPASMQGQVVAGDTVMIHAGVYVGTYFLTNLVGTLTAPIVIKAAPGEVVILSGSSESFHFSDIAYVQISGLIIEHQSGNGMNIDDGGTFNTPSHHIQIKDCVFRNISATGNNDLLKLSGVDDFMVESCIFLNGAAGGSGIDMVGCHRGIFQSNQFTNMGSNSIQIKGGSKDILIRRCRFVNGGAREINIGGSTDLEFFRPQNATFEASKVTVAANLFEGGDTPFAFVGAVDCQVINNTVLRPARWAMRILQETVDPSRFEASGRNLVQNNIFIITTAVSTEINIGPDTAPASFTYSANLWFKEGATTWSGPVLPAADPYQVVGNPGLNETSFSILQSGAAFQKGRLAPDVSTDYYGKNYRNPPSIGAVEFESALALHVSDTSSRDLHKKVAIRVYPNPTIGILIIHGMEDGNYILEDLHGRTLLQGKLSKDISRADLTSLESAVYILKLQYRYYSRSIKIVKI